MANPFDIMGADQMDILGAELMVGGHDEDIFGMISGLDSGTAQLGLERQRGRADLAREIAAKNSAAVVARPYTRARRLIMPFPTTDIPANSTVSIANRPQTPFKGKRLMIPSDIAGSLLVTDFRIGKDSQFVVPGPVPARSFQENAFQFDLDLDTCDVSMEITLTVQNTTGQTVRFNGSLLGISLVK